MSGSRGPVLELTIRSTGTSAETLDAGIERLLARLREGPGVTEVGTFALAADGETPPARLLRLEFPDEAHLQQYLEHPAAGVLTRAREELGDDAELSHRVLREHDVDAAGKPAVARCLNCDAILTGQYCGRCGQRAQSRLISLYELLKDAFGDLFELDSRLWQTLIPLALRPGKLTRAYLDGRRARYMPPFRMYLVLSLAFFVIAFFDPSRDLGILFADNAATVETAADGGERGGSAESVESVDDDAALDTESNAGEAEERRVTINLGNDVRAVGGDQDCELEGYDEAELPDWVKRRFTKQRVQAACRNIISEGGAGWQGVLDGLVENVPAGLFLLLPAMALVLKMLYPLSRRYYVEHLLFVIHYHAFVFLLLTLGVLFGRTAALVGLPSGIAELVSVVGGFYVPVYLYRSLRRVYGQGHLLTVPKFIVLAVVYSIGLGMIMLVAGVLAAFSL